MTLNGRPENRNSRDFFPQTGFWPPCPVSLPLAPSLNFFHRKPLDYSIPESNIFPVKMGEIQVQVKEFVCERCTHKWIPSSQTKPRVCPKCKSPYWDKVKKPAVCKPSSNPVKKSAPMQVQPSPASAQATASSKQPAPPTKPAQQQAQQSKQA